MKPFHTALLAAMILTQSACALLSPTSLIDMINQPGEKALLAGLRAYEDALYPESEKQLKLALEAGLASPKDQAAAHKHLAFIYCSSTRIKDCEAAFQSARQADPTFALSKPEAGHPLWGPIYQRLRPLRP